MPDTTTTKVRWDQKTPSGFDLGTGGAKVIDSDAQPQTEVLFGNGAFTIRLRAMPMHATVDRAQVIKYTREIVKRTAGYNPPAKKLDLREASTEELRAELTRRKEEEGPDSHRPRYPKNSGVDSVEFFLKTWWDAIGLNEDLTIKPGTRPSISKQRVRDRDEYLMKLVESFISTRIKRKQDLGKLEGITFLVKEEKSNRRTRAFVRRHITAPAP
jgi:hypothetical protein